MQWIGGLYALKPRAQQQIVADRLAYPGESGKLYPTPSATVNRLQTIVKDAAHLHPPQ
jgi:hypothetical protein